VIGSKQQTPMGEGAIPFKLKPDAETFQKAQGGRVIAFNEITSQSLETNH
jgi:nitrous oxide reductase accessory protein NosL